MTSERIRRGRLPPLVRYLIIRVFVSLILVFGVTVVTFVLTNLVPTDPVTAMIGERAAGDPAKVQGLSRGSRSGQAAAGAIRHVPEQLASR